MGTPPTSPGKQEIFLGLVSRLGTDTMRFRDQIDDVMKKYDYEIEVIKISEVVTEKFALPMHELPLPERIEKLIEYCNQIRNSSQRGNFLTDIAIKELHSRRKKKDRGVAQNKIYLFDQFKRPDEVLRFKEVYGEQSLLISLHAPAPHRARILSERFAGLSTEHPAREDWLPKVYELIQKDEQQEDTDFGQDVRNAFPLADFVLDVSKKAADTYDRLGEFFSNYFGSPDAAPRVDETGMHAAYSASMRSTDLSRQVGAAVCDDRGTIVITGYNDAPRAGGGSYTVEDTIRYRDIDLDEDANERHKRRLANDFIQKLVDDEIIDVEKLSFKPGEFFDWMKSNSEKSINTAFLLDILEYSRSVHAEMNLISNAARRGVSLSGATLYVTTFPCHNCAKHIVASGISKVVYLEPYPKSMVADLHYDAIRDLDNPVDKARDVHSPVSFEQFEGVAPLRYQNIYARKRRKDARGKKTKWTKRTATPYPPIFIAKYLDAELAVAEIIDKLLPTIIDKLSDTSPSPAP